MSWQVVIERTVDGLGFDPVACERAGGGLLRVFIDRRDDQMVTIEDCELVTRQLQYVLEVEGVDYARLEVSSPGLDRPLRRPADFSRFAGSEVDIVLREPFQGRRKYRGILTPQEPGAQGEASGWSIVFGQGGQEQVLGFALDELKEARLVPVVDFKRRQVPAAAEPAGEGHEPAGQAVGRKIVNKSQAGDPSAGQKSGGLQS